MKIIRYDQDSFSLQEHAITDRCRPSMIALPEYRKQRGIAEWNPAEVGQCPELEVLEEDLLG
jgi:hypothetical protein